MKVNSRTSYFLHLAALTSLAIAQQYLQPLADGADFFVERGATRLDVLLFAFGLVLIPPLALLLAEELVGLVSRGLREALHLAFVGGLAGLIAWQFLTDPGSPVSPLLADLLALAVGGLAALAYRRVGAVCSWLTVLSLAPFVVLALFLVFSPVRSIVFGKGPPAPEPRASSGAPLVMVVFDELPVTSLMDSRERIDARPFPGFARLARAATWYRHDVTVADFTQLAVPSLLTGTRARHDQLQVASEHPHNLFTLLGGSYRLNVWEFNTDLCAEPVCREQRAAPFVRRMRRISSDAVASVPALPAGLRSRIADRLAPGEGPTDLTAPPRASVRRHLRATQNLRFSRFLASLRPSRGRTLDFLHLILPHRPWVYFPSGQRYKGGRPYAASLFAPLPRDPRAVAIAYQRHMLQLQFVDRMIDRLIRRLKRIRLYDRALLVVTADHGASFRPGDLPRVVTRTNVGEVASVPLFVKAPRQHHGRVDDSPVESIDLLPTIARALHVRMPWKVEGRPVGELGSRRRPLTVQRERGEGGEVVVGRGRLARMRRAALRRNRSLLPGLSPFALAPRDWHAGRPLPATLDSPGRYAAMNPRAPRVPVDVSGRLPGRARRPRPIAIAVNGRIVATAWTLVGSSVEYFTALVPSSAFRRGANSVRVVGLSRGT